MAQSRVPSSNVSRAGKRVVVSRLQHGWLRAMGVDVPWIIRQPAVPDVQDKPEATAEVKTQTRSEPRIEPTTEPTAAAVHAPTPAPAPTPVPTPAPTPASEDLAAVNVASLDLTSLAQAIQSCERCGLCQGRQHAVAGEGVDKPKILIVGEAPGEQEDRQGKPFVGRSGQLLDNMMKAIGHGRDTSVFITNVVKCRPPANRNPRDEEIAACAPYLARQIELLAPQAILAMGRFAAHALLNTTTPLQQLRQSTHSIDVAGHTVPVVVTYHPAYLLRRPVDKRLAWDDLKQIKAQVAGR